MKKRNEMPQMPPEIESALKWPTVFDASNAGSRSPKVSPLENPRNKYSVGLTIHAKNGVPLPQETIDLISEPVDTLMEGDLQRILAEIVTDVRLTFSKKIFSIINRYLL